MSFVMHEQCSQHALHMDDRGAQSDMGDLPPPAYEARAFHGQYFPPTCNVQTQRHSYLDAEQQYVGQRGQLHPQHGQPSARRRSRDEDVLLPSPDTSRSDLSTKPIAIPAINTKFAAPFLRAYPPILRNYNLPEEIFMPILDRLNQISAASPPLQVLGLAGGIVGMVPLATTQIVGESVSAAADFSVWAVSKGRVEMYMREINRDIFRPRKLKIEIAKLDGLAKIANIPILDTAGKLDKGAPLLGSVHDLGSRIIDAVARRLQVLEPWIQPLKIEEMPDVKVSGNVLTKLAASTQARAHRKGEEKLVKERGKYQAECEKEMQKNEKEFEKEMRRVEEEQAKEMSKSDPKKIGEIERKKEKTVKKFEKENRRAREDLVGHDKEEEALRKAYYLIIRSIGPQGSPGPYADADAGL